MKKPYDLSSGFLFLYDWAPIIERLTGEEFKELFLALVLRQREEKAFPEFRSPEVRFYASLIEPTIKRRLAGAKRARPKK